MAKETAERDARLIASIVADPDDDAARLVYADALLDRGDARGELIQVQCALAAMDADDARRKRLARREAELLEAHRGRSEASGGSASWLPVAPKKTLHFALVRGFAEEVAGICDEVAEHAEALLAVAPLLASFDLVLEGSGDDTLARFARSAALARARRLVVRSTYAKRRARLGGFLAANVGSARGVVQRLTLESVSVLREDVEALVTAPCFAGLRALVVSMCRLGKDACEPLSRAEQPLERLVLGAYHAGPGLGRALAAGPGLARLRELAIPGNEIGGEALRALVRGGRLREVEELDLRSNELSAKDVTALFDDDVLPRVKRLFLGGNPIGDAGARALARWPGAARLEKLHLGSSEIGDAGALALARSPHLTSLRSLVFSFTKLSRATEEALLASPRLANARLYVGARFLARDKSKKGKPVARTKPR